MMGGVISLHVSIAARRATLAVLLIAAVVALRRPLFRVCGLVLGGAALAFLIAPLSALYEKRLSRPAAAVTAVITVCAGCALLLWLLLPTVAREIGQLGETLPRAMGRVAEWVNAASARVEARLPGLHLPEFPIDGVSGMLSRLGTAAIGIVGNLAEGLSRFSMMLVLACFFLMDRERLLLRLELLTPQSYRGVAIRAAQAAARELRLYLQGQLMVAGAVGALSAAGLALIGVRSALVLGGIVGILNMVPYFGPFIGGVPAVLIALSDGPGRAALCVLVLSLVQQADAAVLSPRIMGSLTGCSPAAVLLAIYAGGTFAGIGGMLVALPVWMSIRTVFRVFVQSRENI